jgi:hypothetical protein
MHLESHEARVPCERREVHEDLADGRQQRAYPALVRVRARPATYSALPFASAFVYPLRSRSDSRLEEPEMESSNTESQWLLGSVDVDNCMR